MAHVIRFFTKLLFFSSLIKVAKFFKISFMIGSTCAFFSGINIALPIVGIFAGRMTSIAVCILCFILRYLLFGFHSFHVLAYYVPGFCACLYFAYPNIFVRLILPILCMILFILHPVGIQAFAYSFFWFIPVLIYCKKSKNIFLHALACTFVAHAVGSVIWIYSLPMNALVWNSLMPQVFLERITFAIGISIICKVIVYLRSKFAIDRRLSYSLKRSLL